jgi:alanyl-tRNA synthetase
LLKSKDLAKSIEKLLEENSALKSEIESFKKKKQKAKYKTGKMISKITTERNY